MRNVLLVIVAVVMVELAMMSVIRNFRTALCQRNDITLKLPRLPEANPVREPTNGSLLMVPTHGMPYQPAPLEQYHVDNAIALGFDKAGDIPDEMASGCEIWNNEENPMHNTAQTFRRELKNYYAKIASFKPLPDLRTLFLHGESNRDEVCRRAELDPINGLLEGFFNESIWVRLWTFTGMKIPWIHQPCTSLLSFANLAFDLIIFMRLRLLHKTVKTSLTKSRLTCWLPITGSMWARAQTFLAGIIHGTCY